MSENNTKKTILSRESLFLIGSAALSLTLIFTATTAFAMEGSYMEGAIGAMGSLFEVIGATIFWVVAGMVSLTLSTVALQWLINNQTTLINFNGEFIRNGLAATQGVADMLLILAFVLASFGIIFKYREFEAKKTVITLFLVAIFTRFGPLIVKMMVDIGNVAINTIIGTNSTLLWDATSVLLKETLYTAGVSLGVIGGTAVLYAIPWVNLLSIGATLYSLTSAAAVLSGIDNIATNWAGNATIYFAVNFLLKWIFQIIACHVLSGVYITFIILFLSRIFMMQILAVISPLAIMAYALPQTRHFFNQWWSSLTKWTFLGVWTLFFLMLGLGSEGFIVPTDVGSITGSDSGVFSMLALNRYMLYYLFLIVYLAMVKDMADKESGMGTLFKSAMIGAGTMAMTHAIKPAASNAQGRFRQMAINKQADIANLPEGEKPSFLDNLALHSSGIMANALDEKRLTNYHDMLSGDKDKASSAAKDLSKAFNLGKPKSWSNIGNLVDSQISQVGKDNTIEKVIAKATKGKGQGKNGDDKEIPIEEAVWALKDAKPEDLSALLSSFGTNSGKYIDYAIKNDKLSPSKILSLGRTSDAFKNGEIKSAAMKDYLLKQDRGKTQSNKVDKFFSAMTQPRTGSAADQKAENEDLVARAILLKEAVSSKKTFEDLPADVLADEKNLKAMMIIGEEKVLGYARENNEEVYEKMMEMIKNNFTELAKSNPGLAKAVARRHTRYDECIPQSVKSAVATRLAQERITNPEFKEGDAFRAVVKDMTI